MTCKTTYECPYCGKRLKNPWSECCHESGHAVRVDPENEADAEYDRLKEAENDD